MTREELFEQNLQERETYEAATDDTFILLPLTRDGFNALVERAAAVYHLPIDDVGIGCIAGYLHHIENDVNETRIRDVAVVMYKSIANHLSWTIDQELKVKRQQEALRKNEEAELQRAREEVVPEAG